MNCVSPDLEINGSKLFLIGFCHPSLKKDDELCSKISF